MTFRGACVHWKCLWMFTNIQYALSINIFITHTSTLCVFFSKHCSTVTPFCTSTCTNTMPVKHKNAFQTFYFKHTIEMKTGACHVYVTAALGSFISVKKIYFCQENFTLLSHSLTFGKSNKHTWTDIAHYDKHLSENSMNRIQYEIHLYKMYASTFVQNVCKYTDK